MLITIQFLHANILTEFTVLRARHMFFSFFLSIFFLILTSFYVSFVGVEGIVAPDHTQ